MKAIRAALLVCLAVQPVTAPEAWALDAGALGCSIAGSGPSVFAFSSSRQTAETVGAAMKEAFLHSKAALASDMWVSPICSQGARIISSTP